MNEIASRSALKLTRRQIFVLGTLAVLLVASAWVASFADLGFTGLVSAEDHAEQSAQPLPVNLLTVHWVEGVQQTRTFTGTLVPKRESELAFELAGTITQINVEEGDLVDAGQPIATLDTDLLAARRNAIQAELNQARSMLDELEAGPRKEKINAARADLAAAKSQLADARQRAQRRQKLIQSQAIPREEYQQAQYAFDAAQATVEAAQQRLAELEAGTRSERILAQRASVEQLKARLEEIEVSIGKSQLRAPFSATVTRRYLDPGGIAQPGQAIVRLVEQDRLEARVGLPVQLAQGLELNSAQKLIVGDQSFRASVTAKVRELNTQTRTQSVLLSIPTHECQRLVPGQLCQLELTYQTNSKGVWVPNTALSKGVRGLWSVMAVEPDEQGILRIQKRDIEVIQVDDQRVLAQGTITNGDQIVADGIHRVTAGQQVVAIQ